jgi:kumamolisin
MSHFSMIGMTIFASSGDSGSDSGVSYPASDPWVTGCGGTTIENVSGTSFTEVAWGGSGGGISEVFPVPEFQSSINLPPSVTSSPPGHIGRGVPDIAGNGNPNSGYMLILNGVSIGIWGGTSAVAPLYAGFVALLNTTLGKPVGYLNPGLYDPNDPYVYNDVTSGGNGGYNASQGWDAVTGWGSIIGKCASLRVQIADIDDELQILQTDLDNIDELPPNLREARRRAILKQMKELNAERSTLEGKLQQCLQQ